MYIIPKKFESYKEYINRILQSRNNKKDVNEYQERHHIVPLCVGGTNDEDNLVYLYAQEHYYAHKLLAQNYPDNTKLQYAWWNMCQCSQNGKRLYNISDQDYYEARKEFSNNMKGNSFALGQKLSEETREKMRKAHLNHQTGENNGMYGKHCSEECKIKIRNKLSGSNNPSAHKVQCIETNQIFSTVKEASEWCGISHSDIAAYIRGKQKSAGKHPLTKEKLHWRYIK